MGCRSCGRRGRSPPSWPSGSFLFAAFLVPPQSTGVLDAAGYRALRTGTVASGVWAVCAVLMVPLTVSDVSGQPLCDTAEPGRHLVGRQPDRHRGRVALDGAVRGGRDGGAASRCCAGRGRRCCSPASLVTLLPLALTGHSSSGGSHDLATNSLLIHLIAGAVWAGGLLAAAGACAPRG